MLRCGVRGSRRFAGEAGTAQSGFAFTILLIFLTQYFAPTIFCKHNIFFLRLLLTQYFAHTTNVSSLNN